MLVRGFKTWCENVSLAQRQELHLEPTAPLAPAAVAEHLGVLVRTVDQIPGLDPRHLRTLVRDDPGSWSAVTLSAGRKRLVLLNPSHSDARRASDLMHELSHLMMGHEPSRAEVTEDGALLVNTYDGRQEEEANWLAGTLLLPRPALLQIRSQNTDLARAAREYGVSEDMLKYRLNVTGVEYQLRAVRRRTRV
jgi:uncharacterized protein DUF955